MTTEKSLPADIEVPKESEWVVVMPAYNAEEIIGECLDAIIGAGFPPETITVVDDGSQDRTAEVAAKRGVNLVRNESTLRPAEARNRGAALAGGDIILFVDSDVCIDTTIKSSLLGHMTDASVTGVIGCYDSSPESRSLVGKYRNLLHAYTHQNSRGEVPTFWTGLGAIRRSALEKAGGFLGQWENIEDVELGLRVNENGGRIILDPDINGKHLKDWSLRTMFATDLFGRAVPWTRLLRSGRMPMGVLATTMDKRISAVAIALSGIGLLAGFFQAWWWILFLISLSVFIGVNFGLFRYLKHSNGLFFALCCMPLHAIHHTAGLLGYSKVLFFERKVSRPNE